LTDPPWVERPGRLRYKRWKSMTPVGCTKTHKAVHVTPPAATSAGYRRRWMRSRRSWIRARRPQSLRSGAGKSCRSPLTRVRAEDTFGRHSRIRATLSISARGDAAHGQSPDW
jgi:hypothetical protein